MEVVYQRTTLPLHFIQSYFNSVCRVAGGHLNSWWISGVARRSLECARMRTAALLVCVTTTTNTIFFHLFTCICMMHTGISEQWHFTVKALVDNLHLEIRDFQSLNSLFFQSLYGITMMLRRRKSEMVSLMGGVLLSGITRFLSI